MMADLFCGIESSSNLSLESFTNYGVERFSDVDMQHGHSKDQRNKAFHPLKVILHPFEQFRRNS